MSLNKKLWIAIIYILILASGGSFILSTLFSKYYLEEQLQVKNNDNATSLALSMSQLRKDSATLDLLISAQFDSGHYRYIGLFDPVGRLMTERVNTRTQTKAPKWFVSIFRIKPDIGIAEVQDGWSQFGTLKIESNLNFAYDKLWESTLLIALWSFIIGIVSCYFGNQALRKILSPLKDIVNQAAAIGEQRFITIKEPDTTEFKAVVSAMNSLSNRIKNTLNEETARLEELRHQAHYDAISGLMNRHYFLSNIDATISHENDFNQGVLVVSRLTNLAQIDQTLGYQETNVFLKRIGKALQDACVNQHTLIAGRLSGVDFAVFSKTPADSNLLGNQIKSVLANLSSLIQADLTCHFVTMATVVTKQDASINLVTMADHVLDEISTNHQDILHVASPDDTTRPFNHSIKEWESLLTSAIDDKRIKLEHYPVVDAKGVLLHHESPVRLQLSSNQNWFCAGEFIGWATQLNLMNRIDTLVLETAISLLKKGAEPIGLNVSADTIRDAVFIKKAEKLISANPKIANRLNFEVPEQGAFDHLDEFKHFCAVVKRLGCRIGIEHVGSRIARLGELHDVGLDYMKIDVSIIREIHTNESNKTLLRGLCMIAHSMGVLAIAEGVKTMDEVETLKLIGIDGMTGPGITLA